MKFRYLARETSPNFRVLTTPMLRRADRPDFGTEVTYGGGQSAAATPDATTLDVSVAGGTLRCTFRPGAAARSGFTCSVRLPSKLVGKDAMPALAVFLNHVLAPVCVGAFSDTTYVDWDDVEDWLRANPSLLLGCGSGDSVAAAYASARESVVGHLDAHPGAEVFLVGFCPAGTFALDAFRSIRAAWNDRIVLHGFPAVDVGVPSVSLLVADNAARGGAS